jgi:NAD(P)-dependent dehydrogenase (short-subunit alcohol dehydrogenase family)
MGEFDGRRVLITGGAGDIGLACARLFLAAGARVHLVDVDESRLRAARDALAPAGRVSATVSALATPADCAAACAGAAGPLHALVHMAGLMEHDALDPSDHRTWDRAIASNLTTAYDMSVAFRAARDTACTTRIVLTSSRAFQRGLAGAAAYSAAKGGIVGLVRSFSREFAPDILVNAVSPGLIATRMTEDLVARHGEQRLAEIPLRRFGRPEDVAGVVGFLCSDAAAYVTGQTITVDGGVLNG